MPLENIPFPNERVYKMKVKSERFYASDQGTSHAHTAAVHTSQSLSGARPMKGSMNSHNALRGASEVGF